jgi:hypothetical protein
VITLDDKKEILVQNQNEQTQIISPLTIENYDQKISVFPTTIEVLTTERKIFLTANKIGPAQVSISSEKGIFNIPIYVTQTQSNPPIIPSIRINLTKD